MTVPVATLPSVIPVKLVAERDEVKVQQDLELQRRSIMKLGIRFNVRKVT